MESRARRSATHTGGWCFPRSHLQLQDPLLRKTVRDGGATAKAIAAQVARTESELLERAEREDY